MSQADSHRAEDERKKQLACQALALITAGHLGLRLFQGNRNQKSVFELLIW